ncbi:MAG TPA: copper amine oxidase N-terminal domain-containing protein [Symbiobacteriaceae bacterium]|nr:copper amine oxidase N-terminal domain-containing protein [Symbiobacteriaceae bacterium]
MRLFRHLAIALFLVLLWTLPAYAAAPMNISLPAEGAVVKGPVLLEFSSSVAGPLSRAYLLDVARGHNATTGFIESRVEYSLKPGTNSIDKPFWSAQGFNPGPYTLRLRMINFDTKEVVAEGYRNITLEGPDYSPKVTLNAPATLGGTGLIGGTVVDTDLATCFLELIDEAGQSKRVAEALSSASFPVALDVGGMKDGTYTLRLTARDAVGQEAVAEQKVQVKNLGPSVEVGLISVDPATGKVPVSFTSTTSVQITVTVKDAAGKQVAVGKTESARRDGTVEVPVSFYGLPAGTYTATAQVKDQRDRTGSDEFTVLVREPLPAPVVGEAEYRNGEYWVTVTLPAELEFVRMESQLTGPGGTQVFPWGVLPRSKVIGDPLQTKGEGKYTYRMRLFTAEGRVSESNEAVVIVDTKAPKLGKVSVAPVDGLGLNMRWEAASDAVGISGYEVVLVDGTVERVLAKAGPESLSYFEALPEGQYQVYLAVTDLGGHRTASDLFTFQVQAGAVALMRGGVYLPTDVPGFIEEGRTWVPLRFFGQALGYTVTWDAGKQAATIVDAATGRTVVATVGDKNLIVTGKEGTATVEIAAAPRLVASRVLVPLRALVEAFGAKVQWHGEIQTVELLGQ